MICKFGFHVYFQWSVTRNDSNLSAWLWRTSGNISQSELGKGISWCHTPRKFPQAIPLSKMSQLHSGPIESFMPAPQSLAYAYCGMELLSIVLVRNKPELSDDYSASDMAYEGADFFEVEDWKGMVSATLHSNVFLLLCHDDWCKARLSDNSLI